MTTIKQEDETASYPACPCCAGTNLKRAVVYGIPSIRCVACHVSLREEDWIRRPRTETDSIGWEGKYSALYEEHLELINLHNEQVEDENSLLVTREEYNNVLSQSRQMRNLLQMFVRLFTKFLDKPYD